MNIVEQIAKVNYAATTEHVEQLARTVQAGAQSAATYLRVLVATCIATLSGVPQQTMAGNTRRRRKRVQFNAEAQQQAIDAAHGHYYGAVLRGVRDTSADDAECNRRATFARTAASTLRGYVRSGGDLLKLDPASITKTALARMAQPPEPQERTARSFMRGRGTVLRAAKRLAADDPEFAAETISNLIEELQAMVDELPETVESDEAQVVDARLERTPRVERRTSTVPSHH